MFYKMLDATNQPIYKGCRKGISKLSLTARIMNIKTDNNLREGYFAEAHPNWSHTPEYIHTTWFKCFSVILIILSNVF